MSRAFVHKGTTYNFPDDATDAEIDEYIKALGGLAGPSRAEMQETTPTKASKTLEFLRPFIMGAATGVGTAVGSRIGMPSAGTAAGAGAGFMLDQAAQIAQGKELGSESMLESGKMLAIQEAAPVLVNPILKFGKGFLKSYTGVAPESIPQGVYDRLRDFKGTFSQYLKDAPIPRFVEDVFSSKIKKERLEEQGKLALKAGEQYAANLAGRPTLPGPHAFGNILQQDIKDNFNKSIAASNFNAQIAEGIANTKLTPVVTAGGLKQVAGPINLSQSTIAELKKELEVLSAPQVTPRQRDFANQIQKLLNEVEVKDPSGQVVGHTPISFRQTWDFKQAADIYGYQKREMGTEVTQARNISKGLNDDLTTSIPNWDDQNGTALSAWNNSKAIVAQRQQVFGRVDAPEVDAIRNATKSVVSKLDAGLNDVNQMQRILASGNITLPTGKVLSSNARRDYQGYTFGKMLQEAWESTNMVDPSEGRFIAGKLFDFWRDPRKQESLKVLFSNPARDEGSNLLEAIVRVSEKQNTTGKVAADIRIGGAGLTLGAGLLAKGLEFTGSAGGRIAGAITGASLGLHVIGRVLNNPRAARYLANIIEEKPLGVSQRFAVKMIMNALQGSEMVLSMKDGTQIPGKIEKGGRFVPLEMPNP